MADTLVYTPTPVGETEEEKQKRLAAEAAQATQTQTQTVYPYQTQQNGTVPLLAQEVPATTPPTTATNPNITPINSNYTQNPLQQQALNAGYQQAINGFNSPVAQQTSANTLNLLNNPSLGYDPTKMIQSKMNQYDINAAQSFEKSRQATAPISGSGQNIKELTSLNLANARQRSDTENQLNDEAVKKMQADYLQALTEGRNTSAMEQNKFSGDIGALTNIINAGNTTEQIKANTAENAINRGLDWAKQNSSQEFQKELATLDGKIKSGQQLSQNDFTAAQNQLNREMELAKQKNDTNAQKELLSIQQEFTAQQAKLSQNFLADQNNLDRLNKITLQGTDIQGQKDIAELQGKIQKGLQLSAQEQQTLQNALDREAKLKAQSVDVDTQKYIAELQSKTQQGLQTSAQDFQAAENILEREAKAMLQKGDIAGQAQIAELQGKIQQGLQLSQQDFQALQNAADRQQKDKMQAVEVAAQKELAELQGKIQQGLQLTNNDFLANQALLDRNTKIAMQSTDIQAQRDALQKQLDFDKWKTDAGFKFTAEQNAANNLLQLSLQSNDQVFQQNMVNIKAAIDSNTLITQQQWQGAQNDLQRQLEQAIADKNITAQQNILQMQQQFQGLQNDMNRQHETDLHNMTINQQQWQQTRTEELTKAGWNAQAAQDQAKMENDRYMQDYDWKKKELMQQGLNSFQADQQAKEWAYKSGEANLDRQLQKEIEAGKLSFQEKQLAQQAMQFNTQQEFQNWCEQNKIDDATANRVWQSAETALSRTHDIYMEKLKEDFTQKGMDFQAIMSAIESMAPEQAYQILNQKAVEAGLTYNGVYSGQQMNDLFLSQYNPSQFKTNLTSGNFTPEYKAALDKWTKQGKNMGLNDNQINNLWANSVLGKGTSESFNVKGVGLEPITITQKDNTEKSPFKLFIG